MKKICTRGSGGFLLYFSSTPLLPPLLPTHLCSPLSLLPTLATPFPPLLLLLPPFLLLLCPPHPLIPTSPALLHSNLLCLSPVSSVGWMGDRLTLFLACSSALHLSTSALCSTSSYAICSASSHTLCSAASLHAFAHLWHSLYFAVLTPSLSFTSSMSCASDQVLMLPRGADMVMIGS